MERRQVKRSPTDRAPLPSREGFALSAPRAKAFLAERGVHVTEKPEGIRISTHFYNCEADVDACVDALVAYRESQLL